VREGLEARTGSVSCHWKGWNSFTNVP